MQPSLHGLRVYPEKFALNLMKAYENWCTRPAAERADIRGRISVNLKKTDKELFQDLPLGDLWLESGIHEVFLYLYNSKHCQRPASFRLDLPLSPPS
mgnify:CR=1 FL=1